MVIAATKRALAARSVGRDQVDAVLECCLGILNGPLSQGESIVALHFERPGGSPIKRSPSDPPPITGEVVRDEPFVADRNSKCGSHHFKHHRERCRRQEREGTWSEDSETSDHRCLPWLRRRSCSQLRAVPRRIAYALGPIDPLTRSWARPARHTSGVPREALAIKESNTAPPIASLAHPLAQLSSHIWSYCRDRLDEVTLLNRDNGPDQSPMDEAARSLKAIGLGETITRRAAVVRE
jgi:hypothetical protein